MSWVTLWRHGEATPGHDDFRRTLSAYGERSLPIQAAIFERVVLGTLGVAPPTHCFHSPRVRTTQTASLLGEALNVQPQVFEGLDFESAIERAKECLAENVEHTLLVGHQPYLGELMTLWLDEECDYLQPGGFCTIRLDVPTRGGGRLVYCQADVGEQ